MQTKEAIWQQLELVCDPEVPVLSILDLGIVRDVQVNEAGEATILITPTYSGCPAMQTIAIQIRMEIMALGFQTVHVQEILSPAWSTDWMTEAGKEKLSAYGIAPPQYKSSDSQQEDDGMIRCPQCHSSDTVLVSRFGSTACKALYKCRQCLEPFDYFKCH